MNPELIEQLRGLVDKLYSTEMITEADSDALVALCQSHPELYAVGYEMMVEKDFAIQSKPNPTALAESAHA